MADETNQEKELKPKGGSGKMILFSGAGLAVVIAAAFLFATFAVPAAPEGAGGGEPAEGPAAAEGAGITTTQYYEIRDVMVNVKGTNKKQILKTSLNLMYETDRPEATAKRFDSKKIEIKNALNILLTGKTREELEGSEEMNMLAIELQDLLNRVVFPDGGGRIIRIYYDEFIIQ